LLCRLLPSSLTYSMDQGIPKIPDRTVEGGIQGRSDKFPRVPGPFLVFLILPPESPPPSPAPPRDAKRHVPTSDFLCRRLQGVSSIGRSRVFFQRPRKIRRIEGSCNRFLLYIPVLRPETVRIRCDAPQRTHYVVCRILHRAGASMVRPRGSRYESAHQTSRNAEEVLEVGGCLGDVVDSPEECRGSTPSLVSACSSWLSR